MLEEVNKKLDKLAVEWAVIDNVHLERIYEFENFKLAIKFVNKVAKIAEDQNHHPDILIHDYKKVRIQTTTHDAMGLTVKDFKLANALDE